MDGEHLEPDEALRAEISGQLAKVVHELPAANAIPRRQTTHRLSVLEWGRRFLPRHFRRAPSRMHRWLGVELGKFARRRGCRLNVLGPRGGAKSTIGNLCFVLKCALEAREPYIWIVSDTKNQAETHLANVKIELEQNELLAEAYPDEAGRGPTWRLATLELRNGCVIECYGTGQQLRGRRRREHRPSLIVCDDLQNDAHILSAQQRDATTRWFHGTLLKAGDKRTNIVNLATALHRDALAMQLHTSPAWTSALFRSIERWPDNMDLWREWELIYSDVEDPNAAVAAQAFFDGRRDEMIAGAELLWPDEEDLYTLMRMRTDEGHTAFEREKQNSPIDPERCEWPEEYFGDHIWFRDWPRKLALCTIALDPSKGSDSRHGDYSAFVMLGIDEQGTLYVEADMARRPTPQIVGDGVELCRRFRPDAFGVEANQFQELLAADFVAAFARRRLRGFACYGILNHGSKLVRIRKLGPYLSQRRVRFRSLGAGTRLLVEQLRDFPLGAHDDGPDALEMAIRLADVLRSETGDDGLGTRLIQSE